MTSDSLVGSVEPASPPSLGGATWRVARATVTGRYHRSEEHGNDDAWAMVEIAPGLLALAVADGVSSSARGGEGAVTAVTAAVTALRDAPEASAIDREEGARLLLDAIFAAAVAIGTYAETDGAPLTDFDTTLCCVLVAPDWVAMAQVGDGAVVTWAEDGSLALPLPPQRLEFAGDVYSIARLRDRADVAALAFVATTDPVAGLALTTDGLQEIAFSHPGPIPYPAFFQPVFAKVSASAIVLDEDLAAFLASPRVADRAGDDLTLLVVTKPDVVPAPGLIPAAGEDEEADPVDAPAISSGDLADHDTAPTRAVKNMIRRLKRAIYPRVPAREDSSIE